MSKLRRVCVFCGSSAGERPEYRAAAEALGTHLAQRGIGLIYGGGRVGLMGILADACIQAGGTVIGVIPQALMDKELGHGGCTELFVVPSMHERKAKMAELADAFVALPGGIGTFEELFEVWTWNQLGFIRKPCGLLNVASFFDKLLEFVEHATDEGFMRAEHLQMLQRAETPDVLLDQLENYVPPDVEKWLRRDET